MKKNLVKVTTMLVVIAMLMSVFSIAFAGITGLNDINSHWSKRSVERLVGYEILSGYPDSTFRPDNTMTNAEFATVLSRSMELNTTDTKGEWYQKYLNAIEEAGYIGTNNDSILSNPQAEISRIIVANTFYNVVKKIGLTKFDMELVPQTFSDVDSTDSITVSVISSLGIFSGYPDNTFKPQGNITRAEVATVFSNVYFGKRDSSDLLVTLPVFNNYADRYSEITKERIATIKNGEELTEEETTIEDLIEDMEDNLVNAEDLEESVFIQLDSFDEFIYAYLGATGNKVLVDKRDLASYDDRRIEGAIQCFNLNNLGEYTQIFIYDGGYLGNTDKEILLSKANLVTYFPIPRRFKGLEQYEQYLSPVKDLSYLSEVDEDSEVPAHLQTRFNEVADEFNLTWTDAEFEHWYTTSSQDEKDKYLFDFRRVPEFDFEHKVVKIADRTDLDLPNVNPNNVVLGIDDMGYIGYEMYKRNVEYLMKDGADWGQFSMYYLDDMAERGFFIKMEDQNRESFKFSITGNDWMNKESELSNASNAKWYVVSLEDSDVDIVNPTVPEDLMAPYIKENTRMNALLLFGIQDGEELFASYLSGFGFKCEHYSRENPGTQFDKVIGEHNVVHHWYDGAAGYFLDFER